MAKRKTKRTGAGKKPAHLKNKSTRPVRVLNSRTQLRVTIVIKKPQFKKIKKKLHKIVKKFRKQRLKDHLVTGSLIAVFLLCLSYLVSTQLTPYLFASRHKVVKALPVNPSNSPSHTSYSLPRSEPLRLVIPSISVDTELMTLGKNPDGTIEVPARTDIAGWYKHAPTPGEIGPAIITGHLNNYTSWNGVFSKLSSIAPGERIEIMRADSSTVVFQVDRVEQVSQTTFPTQAVYGDINYPGLRLITCGGSYNYLAQRYSENTVVFASIVEPV